MQREYYNWHSDSLNKEVEVASYGHYGTNVLLFSANTPNHKEIEENGFLDSITKNIKTGRYRIFSVSNLMDDCWYDYSKRAFDRSKRHFEFNQFIENELVNRIYSECGGPVPILTAGAGYGGYLAANVFLRRPDIFIGTIALSATFNIEHYAKDYFDENCYFNSPMHYMPNLTDSYWISHLMTRRHIYLASGSGENEFPHNTIQMAEILENKGLRVSSEIWGQEYGHNWLSWAEMLRHFLHHKI